MGVELGGGEEGVVGHNNLDSYRVRAAAHTLELHNHNGQVEERVAYASLVVLVP